MLDHFDIRSSQLYWLIPTLIITAAFGVIGYFIVSRRIKQPIAVFLARFGIVFFLLFFLELAVFIALPSFHATMQNLTARLVSGILTLAGASHFVSGSTITLQNPYLAFDITSACLGGELFWTFAALVLAETSASNKQRLIGILIGLSILILFNFFRIVLSIYVEWLTDFRVHTLFYFFNMVFVLLVWAGWLRTLKPQTVPRASLSLR
jgi:exosortase/archaeosortase family protein